MLRKVKVSVSLSKMAGAGAQVQGTKNEVFRKNNNDIFLVKSWKDLQIEEDLEAL